MGSLQVSKFSESRLEIDALQASLRHTSEGNSAIILRNSRVLPIEIR